MASISKRTLPIPAFFELFHKRIEEVIYSAESPVGIDAKKTHVMILHMLEQIDERLRRLESASASP